MDLAIKSGLSAALSARLTNLSKTGRSRKQALSVLVDSILVCLAIWGAYSLRLGRSFNDFSTSWHLFTVMPLVTVLVIASLGIYRWKIRSCNRALFLQLAKACLVSAVALALLTFLFPPDIVNPRSIFIIYGLLLATGTFGVRLVWQSLFDSGSSGEPVAIYGAGTAGSMLVQSLNSSNEYRPVVLLDDDPALIGTTVSGLCVIAPDLDALAEQLTKYDVGRIILAMPSISAPEYENKIEALNCSGLPIQTVPTYSEIVSGTATMGQVRDISISDILGRTEVPPDLEIMGKCVAGKTVLVTGAGGSIGSELCRQLVKLNPLKLIALDQCEENLYKLTEELEDTFMPNGDHTGFVPVLCSVTDAKAIDTLMDHHTVETIYHAAAYKHVPIVEKQPEQGVAVNVFGTLCVLDAAIRARVSNFVLISTDKAVRPTNAMGASKRVAELILQAKAKTDVETRISMVRFGNVLGSSGSVVPKFKKQIESGGPITLTDPNITRYFMTIPEAVQLVLQSSAIAKGGDVFVLDMGAPVRIEDLAISMVRLSGKRLKRVTGNSRDIEIVVEGLRPGEKMYEELFTSDFNCSTTIQKVFTADEVWMKWPELSKELDNLSTLSAVSDRPMLRSKLLDLAFHGQVATVTSETASSSSHKTVIKKIKPRRSLPAPHASAAKLGHIS